MKLSYILPLAAVSTALVLPSEQVFQQIQKQQEAEERADWYQSILSAKDEVLQGSRDMAIDLQMLGEEKVAEILRGLDVDSLFDTGAEVQSTVYDKVEEWTDWFHGSLGSGRGDIFDHQLLEEDFGDFAPDELERLEKELDRLSGSWYNDDESVEDHGGHHGGHHGHHPPPPPHHGPHHPPHHGHDDDDDDCTANHTVYELIKHSKYSTVLADLIGKYPDLVDRLNSTKHNVTVFAPTDKAFSKIPEKVLKKLSKKEVEAILEYHIVPGVYPSGRLLFTQTAPTLLKSDHLASKPEAQRITFRKGFKGISLNFYSRVIAANIFGSNGVVHGVDSPIFPPIGAIQEIDLFPGTFSTLELALVKTGLFDEMNSTDHAGGTLFAPNNWAFEKLGPRINAFLFSPAGRKYLKALLLYHVVPDNTLYSDAYYHAEPDKDKDGEKTDSVHVDLPTALEGHRLAVDISRWGPIVTIKINGFTRVAVADVVAEDGVIHVLTSVLIPPKKPRSVEDVVEEDGELTVEELIERLEPYVDAPARKDDL